MVNRYKLIISYDGSTFYGYQKQPNKRSVQEEIENTLSQLLNFEEIKLLSAGRTDRGVHATYQVGVFDTIKDIKDLSKFKYSINCLLPKDIYIKEVSKCPNDFMPRFEVKYKIYEYYLNNKEYDPLKRNYELYYPKFNKDKVNSILNLFIGYKNFQNFTSKEVDEDNFYRNIMDLKLVKTSSGYKFVFKGDGFMRYEIRKIVGTILAFNDNKISKEEIEDYLNKEKRDIIPFQIDAKGLYLTKIVFNKHKKIK